MELPTEMQMIDFAEWLLKNDYAMGDVVAMVKRPEVYLPEWNEYLNEKGGDE